MGAPLRSVPSLDVDHDTGDRTRPPAGCPMTRLGGRALDLVVDVLGARTDALGRAAGRAATVCEDTAELLRLFAILTGACP